MLTVGSLFSGIGGIDLGLERTGQFRTIWFSEIDTYANRVLAKHWPNVPNLGNVKEIDFGRIERPDVLVGGYPCQPFSTAGKREGENDPRHLWPECVRALRILRPRYALFENVRGHLSLGFPRVLTDLASLGFNAEWQIIPASAVGAPHKRDRLFIVAYPSGECSNGVVNYTRDSPQLKTTTEFRNDSGAQNVADAEGNGQWRGYSADSATLQEWVEIQSQTGRSSSTMANTTSEQLGGYRSQEPVTETSGQRDHNSRGKSCNEFREWWKVEPDVGRMAYGVPARVDRLKGLGNAVVPQVAEYVGYLIAEHARNA